MMTGVTLFFTVAGVVTMTRGIMAVISHFDRQV